MTVKRIFIPSALCGIVAFLGGCTNTSTQNNNINVVNNNTTIVAAAGDSRSEVFDIDAVIKNMGRRRMRSGESADAGIWLVCRVKVSGDDKQQALALAEIRAKRSFAEWIKSTVSKKAVSQSMQKVDGENVVSHSFYSSLTKVDSRALLRGVTFHSF